MAERGAGNGCLSMAVFQVRRNGSNGATGATTWDPASRVRRAWSRSLEEDRLRPFREITPVKSRTVKLPKLDVRRWRVPGSRRQAWSTSAHITGGGPPRAARSHVFDDSDVALQTPGGLSSLREHDDESCYKPVRNRLTNSACSAVPIPSCNTASTRATSPTSNASTARRRPGKTSLRITPPVVSGASGT